ncbi:MAG: hypothetical protein ACR2P1_14870 [Pseudomonadales bacterium]
MTQQSKSTGNKFAAALNRDCYCIAVNKSVLHDSLEAHLRDSNLPEQLLAEHSHLFADSPVFLWQGHIEKMEQLIRAVESLTRNGAYRDAVLATAPASVRHDLGPRGVFFGYDFHLGADGPQLIEINTNAGGVLLNLYLAAAQQACCDTVINFFGGKANFADVEKELIAMFKKEWQLQYPDKTLYTIAIVDNDPSAQFLYPEFLLFQSLFARHGIEAVIADPKDFIIKDHALWLGKHRIDLVYNRLTDFYLEMPESACLLEAYQQGMAVVSPSPHTYALYADKRNLPLLSDSNRLKEFGVEEEVIDVLENSLPTTVAVTQDNADQLWGMRKQLFFKPATGYGSRGAYRGAKLTRRVWENILKADYIAQAIVPPSERQLIINGDKQSLKLDIRCVTYNGKIQQLSARLYQGQTTNLRTEGGGLATVFPTPEGSCC